MKKKLKLAIAIILLVMVSWILMALLFMPELVFAQFFSVASRWHDCAEYKEYKREFAAVKDYILEYYHDEALPRELLVRYNDSAEEVSIYDQTNEVSIDCPPYIYLELKTIITSAFNSDNYLDYISIEENRIAFVSYHQRYALVYSIDGKKPTYLASPKDKSIHVKRLGGGWYHVVRD